MVIITMITAFEVLSDFVCGTIKSDGLEVMKMNTHIQNQDFRGDPV